MKHPDNTVPTLEAWLNAYWRYLEPERLLLGDTTVFRQLMQCIAPPPENILSLKCRLMGNHWVAIYTEEGWGLSSLSFEDLQKLLTDQYPQFLEGIQWYSL